MHSTMLALNLAVTAEFWNKVLVVTSSSHELL